MRATLISYVEPIEANPVDGNASLRELVADMDADLVDILVIVGGNPVYNAPADLDFAGKMTNKVKLRIHLSLYNDETSELCQWHIPESHYLESWSDARAYDGTATIIQPLIAPLYSSKTAHELIAAFSDQPDRRSYDIVRDYWQRRMRAGGEEPPIRSRRPAATNQATGAAAPATPRPATAQPATPQAATAQPAAAAQPAASQPQTPSKNFEQFWRKALHDGVIANTAAKPKTVSVSGTLAASASQPPASGVEIVFRPDPTIHDGRFANNGWLQELPKPLSKLTWDNAAFISPATAARYGIGKQSGNLATNAIGNTGGEIVADVLRLDYKGRTLSIPAWIEPGHPDDCVTRASGIRANPCGQSRKWDGLQCLFDQDERRAVVRLRIASRKNRRHLFARRFTVDSSY